MPKKVVISISIKDPKDRKKAFKIAVSQTGVDAASIKSETGELEVVGNFDPVTLARMLRKKVGQADLQSYGSAEKKEEKKKDETPNPQAVTITYDPSSYYLPPYPFHCQYPGSVYEDYYNQPRCSIM